MKTLYGMHRPDEGTIALDGEQVVAHQPAATPSPAASAWCTSTSSSPTTSPSSRTSSSASEPKRGIRLDFDAARTRILEISDHYGLDVDPDALVEDLGVGERQRVEILKVLYRGARTLILDEPTAVLVPQEVDELFDALRELKSRGPRDHVHLAQARRGAEGRRRDHRHPPRHDGRHPCCPADVTARKLAELMVGSELPTPETRESTVTDVEELVVEGLTLVDRSGRALLSDVSLHDPPRRGARHRRRRGQRPGRARRDGHGHAEGRRPARVHLGGEDITAWSTRTPARVGHRATSPRTASGTACCSRRRCGRTGCSATRRRRRTARACSSTARAPAPTPSASSQEYDVRTPVDRRPRLGAVGRQPAEAHRRPRDERQPDGAHRRPPHPRRRRRRPGRRSGTSCGRPARRGWRCCSSRPTSTSSSACPTPSR